MRTFEELLNASKPTEESKPARDFETLLKDRREDYGTEPIQSESGQYQVGGEFRSDTNPDRIGVFEIPLFGVGPNLEAPISTATGMVADTVGDYMGGGAMALEELQAKLEGRYANPMAGPDTAARMKEYLTYRPRSYSEENLTPLRQQLTDKFASVTGSAIDWARDKNLIPKAPDQFLDRPVQSDAILQDGQYQVGGEISPMDEIEARTAAAYPSIVQSGLVAMGGKTQNISSKYKPNVGPQNARFIWRNGKQIEYPLWKKAKSQGWSDGVLWHARQTAAKGGSTQNIAIRMIRDTRKALIDRTWGAKPQNRPWANLGTPVLDRYNWLKSFSEKIDIDGVAKGYLSGKYADSKRLLAKWESIVKDLGGKRVDGKLTFPPSPDGRGGMYVSGKSNAATLARMDEQIRAMGSNPDAYAWHNLKQTFYKTVKYGKKAGTDNPISDEVSRQFKGFANDINENLRVISDNYKNANDIFSDVQTAIDGLDDAFGNTLDGLSKEAATGKRLRRIIGNAVSGEPIDDAVSIATDVANRYGAEFDDSLIDLIQLAGSLDDVLNSQIVRTNAKSELGGKAARVLERSTLHNIADASDNIVNKVTNRSDMEALNTLLRLVEAGE